MYFKKVVNMMTEATDNHQLQKHLQHISESYKNIRASLMFALAGTPKEYGKTIIFTSAEQGDGKTTTCLNLAAAFAEAGAKVLIVDADLRRPQMERYIYLERERKGLSDVLGGFCDVSEVIIRPDGCNFDCLFSGSIPPNPSELLMMKAVGTLFETLSKEYDYIFIDTPPVGVVSETLCLTQFVSGVVLVAKKRKTHLRKLHDTISSLEFANANILGVVMNGSLDAMSRSYYHYKDRYNNYYYYQ